MKNKGVCPSVGLSFLLFSVCLSVHPSLYVLYLSVYLSLRVFFISVSVFICLFLCSSV